MAISIPLSKNTEKYAGKYEAIVDDCDSDLANMSWNVRVSPNSVYARRTFYLGGGRKNRKQKTTYIHIIIFERMIAPLKLERGEEVDHIDGNGLNNQRRNLRRATRSQNQANAKRRKDNKTGKRGVCLDKQSGKFLAYIDSEKKRIRLGLFEHLEDAIQARIDAEKKHFGNFRRNE